MLEALASTCIFSPVCCMRFLWNPWMATCQGTGRIRPLIWLENITPRCRVFSQTRFFQYFEVPQHRDTIQRFELHWFRTENQTASSLSLTRKEREIVLPRSNARHWTQDFSQSVGWLEDHILWRTLASVKQITQTQTKIQFFFRGWLRPKTTTNNLFTHNKYSCTWVNIQRSMQIHFLRTR